MFRWLNVCYIHRPYLVVSSCSYVAYLKTASGLEAKDVATPLSKYSPPILTHTFLNKIVGKVQ